MSKITNGLRIVIKYLSKKTSKTLFFFILYFRIPLVLFLVKQHNPPPISEPIKPQLSLLPRLLQSKLPAYLVMQLNLYLGKRQQRRPLDKPIPSEITLSPAPLGNRQRKLLVQRKRQLLATLWAAVSYPYTSIM